MNPNNTNNNAFIIVSLFLLAVVAFLLLAQLIVWIIVSSTKKIKLPIKSYQTLLNKEDYQGTTKKVRIVFKFNNYNKKQDCLKLQTNDFEEKTLWNLYHNLISVLVVRWKKTNQKTSIILSTSTIVFYLSAIATIIFALIYYINLGQGTIDAINITLLSILSFINLVILVLSWLIWTMNYEKVRKEIIALASNLDNPKLLKAISRISGFKTLFPSSELLI